MFLGTLSKKHCYLCVTPDESPFKPTGPQVFTIIIIMIITYLPTPGVQTEGDIYKSSGAASITLPATAKSLQGAWHQGYI